MLLIAVALIFLWLSASFTNSIIANLGFKNSDIAKLQISDDSLWLNSAKAINPTELQNRIVILHFWSQSCISCNDGIQKLNKFSKEMGNRVAVIGVHSAKFSNDPTISNPVQGAGFSKNKNSVGESEFASGETKKFKPQIQRKLNEYRSAIKKAVLRHDIEHLTIIDQDDKIGDNYQIDEWPSYLLFNTNGKIVEKLSGSGSVDRLIKKAKKLINRNKFSLENKKLPIVLEKKGIKTNVLAYPTKLIYVPNFQLKNKQFPALIIANSGKNSVIISSLKGEIIVKIGSEIKGFNDGSFSKAQFNAPQAVLYDGKNLLIADTENHAIRIADFSSRTVKTLIGSGILGEAIIDEVSDPKKIELYSPTDLEFFPDNKNLVIANAGTNQILNFNLESKILRPLAGNGDLGRKDGKFPNNSLAQTADMAVFNNKLYLIDSLSSSLRQLDKDGNLQTLIKGRNLNQKNNIQPSSLQLPQALFVDDTGIYIADTLNHKIKKYDFNSGQLLELFGSTRGNDIGNKLTLDEPCGLVAMLDRIYISDTNNNRIILANRGSKASELLDVIPTSNIQKDSLLEFIPENDPEPAIQVKNEQKITFKIKLKSGWKINDQAPSYLNLLTIEDDENAVLMQNFDSQAIKSKQIDISTIKSGLNYVLQGKIYYCREGINSLCYVKNYQQAIKSDSTSSITKVEIDLTQ